MVHRQAPCVKLEGPPKETKSEYYSAFAKTNNGQYKCLKCNRYFDTRMGVGSHLSRIHKIRMTKDERLIADRDNHRRMNKERMDKINTETAKPQNYDAVFLPNLPPKTTKPMPETIVESKLQKESAKLIIKFCTKCNTIWDGAYSVKFCPDCGTELKEPLKRKTFQVVQ